MPTPRLKLFLILAIGLCVTPANASDELQTGVIGSGNDVARYVIFDPGSFSCRVVYTNPPRTVQEQHRLANAAITVNGGYWTAEYKPTDLLVSDGKVIGRFNAKSSFKGLLEVTNARVALRDLSHKPHSTKEKFEQALRCGPVIVRDSAIVPTKSTTRHRRTVAGQSRDGRLFFLVSDRCFWTYEESAKMCLRAPLNAKFAFQLDGGGSTGMAVDHGTTHVSVGSVAVGSHIQLFLKMY